MDGCADWNTMMSSCFFAELLRCQDPKGRKRATSLGRSRALTIPTPTEVVNSDLVKQQHRPNNLVTWLTAVN